MIWGPIIFQQAVNSLTVIPSAPGQVFLLPIIQIPTSGSVNSSDHKVCSSPDNTQGGRLSDAKNRARGLSHRISDLSAWLDMNCPSCLKGGVILAGRGPPPSH